MGRGKELGKNRKVVTKEYKWECQGGKRGKKNGRAVGGKITRVKMWIKEKGEEEGCIERNVQIGSKWWKIMTIYSKEMKTTRRGVEYTIKKKQGRM
jgi:hypothetical protein